MLVAAATSGSGEHDAAPPPAPQRLGQHIDDSHGGIEVAFGMDGDVVAEHLAPATAGHEYRCWVDVDGHRTGIGKMFFGGDLAYWVGDVPKMAG